MMNAISLKEQHAHLSLLGPERQGDSRSNVEALGHGDRLRIDAWIKLHVVEEEGILRTEKGR